MGQCSNTESCSVLLQSNTTIANDLYNIRPLYLTHIEDYAYRMTVSYQEHIVRCCHLHTCVNVNHPPPHYITVHYNAKADIMWVVCVTPNY